jgi:hypothetical protein
MLKQRKRIRQMLLHIRDKGLKIFYRRMYLVVSTVYEVIQLVEQDLEKAAHHGACHCPAATHGVVKETVDGRVELNRNVFERRANLAVDLYVVAAGEMSLAM